MEVGNQQKVTSSQPVFEIDQSGKVFCSHRFSFLLQLGEMEETDESSGKHRRMNDGRTVAIATPSPEELATVVWIHAFV